MSQIAVKVVEYKNRYYAECGCCGARTNVPLPTARASEYCYNCKDLLVIVPGKSEIVSEESWRE